MRKRILLLALIGAVVASGALVGASASRADGGSGTEVNVWIGLKNSDDVGTSFDIKASVCQFIFCGYGETDNVWGGSSGFNNAHLVTVPVYFYIGTNGFPVNVTVWARVSCSSRHVSGTARLWYNDWQANSNVDEEYGFGTLYLVSPLSLSPSVGPGPKLTSDVFVKKSGCPEQPDSNWKSFGTWTGSGGST